MEELLAGLGAGDFDDYEDDAPAAVECATEDDGQSFTSHVFTC